MQRTPTLHDAQHAKTRDRFRTLAIRDHMTPQTVLLVVALVLALIEEFGASGRSLIGWAVVFVCVSLLWGQL